MKWLFEVYKAQCRMTLVRYLEYRVELHIWLAQILLRPIIFMAVWASAAKGMGGKLHGFTPRDFAAYFIIAMLVNHFSLAWMMIEWEPLIKTGELSNMLVRPSHVIHRYIGENITFKATTMPFMLIAAGVLVLMFSPVFSFVAWALAVAVPALILALMLYFALSFMLGMLSFWTTEVEAVNTGFYLLMLLFSGQISPISMSPPIVQRIGAALPFYWIIGFPTELILGHVTPAGAANGIVMQLFWFGLSCVGMNLLWRRGMKTYTAVGI